MSKVNVSIITCQDTVLTEPIFVTTSADVCIVFKIFFKYQLYLPLFDKRFHYYPSIDTTMRNFNILLTYTILRLLKVSHLFLSAVIVIISLGYFENIREQR